MLKKMFAFAVLGLYVTQSFADTTEPIKGDASTVGSVYKELDALRSQNAILAERAKSADLQAKIAPQKPIGLPTSPMPSAMNSTGFNDPLSARVMSITGLVGKLKASIQMPDGGLIDVRVGSKIPGLGVVKEISADGVQVDVPKKKIISIPFASETTTTSNPQNPMMPGAY